MTRYPLWHVCALAGTLLLVSCGGSDGGTAAAPAALSYPSPQTYLADVPITALAPTVTGAPTAYSVNPALPAGLALSAMSGVISGTPTSVSPQTSYTVTASNPAGSTSATLVITVNDLAAPQIAYASTTYGFSAGIPGSVPAPVNAGGGQVTYSIAPDLPAGLTLGSDGSIQGTPAAASSAATYTVTATNARASATFPLTIAAGAAPLLDLGHVSTVDGLRIAGSRLLSTDERGHWLLQDFTSGGTVASGDSPCPELPCTGADLAGDTLVDAISSGLEIRAASDGHLITAVTGTPASWQLAADGSYLVTADASGLTVYDTTTADRTLSTRSGDYSKAVVFATPAAVQVAKGPAGTQMIESVSPATGGSTVSPAFLGAFATWFQDGGRFLTVEGTAVRTYSSEGVQQDITQVTTAQGLAGQGSWFWTFDAVGAAILSVYQVGASAAPALTTGVGIDGKVISSGSTLGLLSFGTGQVQVVDLSGSLPTLGTPQTVPIAYLSAYAATSPTAWVTANRHGVILDGASLAGTPRYLTHGQAWSIAGGTSSVSVATASGSILTFDPATNAGVTTLAFPASQLSVSTDGTLLAAAANELDAQYETDRSIRLYSLPSGSLLHSLPFAYPGPPLPTSLSLSGGGTALALTFLDASGGCGAEQIPAAGGSPIWCGSGSDLRLSPDGTLLSVNPNPSVNGVTNDPNATVNILRNGVLAGSAPGQAVGWVDNGRLLLNAYATAGNSGIHYTGASLYDPAGTLLAAAPVPELLAIQPLTGDTVYSPDRNFIVSLTDGQVSWASANTGSGTGAAAGAEVVFVSGTYVLAQPAPALQAVSRRQRLSLRR